MLNYDYIILGTGAAGLSLVLRMIESPFFIGKKILLIDKDPKARNDRTWCFWEKASGFFEEIVHKKWDRLSFLGDGFSGELDIQPYQYKMIRGIDFYAYCLGKISKHPGIDIIYGDVRSVVTHPHEIIIHLSDRQLHCHPAIVFNSIYSPSDPSKKELKLLQHFKGWVIESPQANFKHDAATLMDFRIHQQHGTSFMYVLPTAQNRALIEYTLFTPQLLEPQQYDKELRNYISSVLKLENYEVKEEEFGIIPMTNAKFNFFENGMYNIGVAGGQTKPSTGYTFQFIQKQSDLIVDALAGSRPLTALLPVPKRFHFYDSVLLQLLVSKKLGGKEIFTRMFSRNKASQIFKFLDNETTIFEELRLISTLQTTPFLKAALQLV